MIFLKRFTEILNEIEKDYLITGNVKKENVYDAIQKAKVFVIRGHEDSAGIAGDLNAEIVPFSLPFETCWFEVYDGTVVSWEGVGEKIHTIRGVLIEEVAPNTFNYAILVESGHKGKSAIVEQVITVYDGAENHGFFTEVGKMTKKAVEYIINRINNTDAVGLVKTSERVKLKTSHGKVIHKIRRIIHIVPKKLRGQSIPGEGKVEWTHRWLVRGHWRKLEEGLGKDRSGEYNVKGWTWVTEHQKGPENAPVILNKVRLVSPTKQANQS